MDFSLVREGEGVEEGVLPSLRVEEGEAVRVGSFTVEVGVGCVVAVVLQDPPFKDREGVGV